MGELERDRALIRAVGDYRHIANQRKVDLRITFHNRKESRGKSNDRRMRRFESSVLTTATAHTVFFLNRGRMRSIHNVRSGAPNAKYTNAINSIAWCMKNNARIVTSIKMT